MKKIQFKAENDYTLSPYSGWTRSHYEDLFIQMMAALMDNVSEGGARQRIPGPRSHHGQLADELEGITRPLFMAGPWLSQSGTGVFEYGGKTYDVGAFYRRALLAGTDRNNGEYWGDIVDYAQHLVEMAALSWGLYVSRKHTWDKMKPEEQDQVAAYLFQCTKVKYHENNWLLFNVITNAVLKAFGKPCSREQIDANLSACEGMYMGEGWYRDGNINRIDYYNAWAFHFYYLMWVFIDGDSKPELAETHKERCRDFVRDFRYFFGKDGATPCFGRSMTYRFGYLAPVAMGVLLECLDIGTGEAKTMMNLGLKFFFDQEILTKDGHLSLGYIHPNESILEHYSCGGSPYWAVKALSIFLLPENHPFWSAKEEPLPIHKGNFSRALPMAGLLLRGNGESGHIQLINHKSYHDKDEYNAKYTNFAYSSVFPYESRPVYKSWNMDNALLFSGDGVNYFQRWEMEHKATEENFCRSAYGLHNVDPEGRVETFTLFKGDSYINIHVIQTEKEGIDIKEGGYPLGLDVNDFSMAVTDSSSAVSGGGRLSFVKNLYGWDKVLEAVPLAEQLHGTNARYRYSRVPGVAAFLPKGRSLYITQVTPFVGSEDPAPAEALVQEIAVEEAGSGFIVAIGFSDGEKVRLDSSLSDGSPVYFRE